VGSGGGKWGGEGLDQVTREGQPFLGGEKAFDCPKEGVLKKRVSKLFRGCERGKRTVS